MSNSYGSKHWAKPPKWFKKLQKKRRKAKERSALKQGKEVPIFKKSDGWDYL